MAERAKIVRNGSVQLVELPPSVRFPDDQEEVIVYRDRDRVILKALDLGALARGWSLEFLAALGALGPDEVFERPPQTPITEVKDPFDE